jgi:hypothetical protein
VLALISIDQSRQHVEPIPFRRSQAHAPQPFDLS